MQSTVIFTVVSFLLDRHKDLLPLHTWRYRTHVCSCYWLMSPKTTIHSSKRIKAVFICGVHWKCFWCLCVCTFIKLFSSKCYNKLCFFFVVVKKSTFNNTYSCVPLFFPFFFLCSGIKGIKTEKRGTCLEIVSAPHLLCVSSFLVWTKCKRMCLCYYICSILSTKICILGHFCI